MTVFRVVALLFPLTSFRPAARILIACFDLLTFACFVRAFMLWCRSCVCYYVVYLETHTRVSACIMNVVSREIPPSYSLFLFVLYATSNRRSSTFELAHTLCTASEGCSCAREGHILSLLHVCDSSYSLGCTVALLKFHISLRLFKVPSSI
jgi:hypothetical protein